MNEKSETFFSKNHFYVFVRLNNGKTAPDYFIVPSKKVADYIREGHAAWLQKKDKKGLPHYDTSLRQFADKAEKYKDRWDLLGLD